MFLPIKLYFKDRWISFSFSLTLASQILMLWRGTAELRSLAEQVFLHYNSIFGVDLIGSWQKILYIPVLGIIIFSINFCVSFFLYASERFLSRLVALAGCVFNILLLVGLWFLVGLNI